MRISDWSSDVCSSDLHIGAGAGSVLPQAQQHRHFVDRESQSPRALDEAQDVDVVFAVDAIVALGAQWSADQSDRLVVPDHLRRHARGGGCLSDVHVILPRRLRQTRSEEHTSELQSLMRISYAVFCLKKKKK